MSSSVLGCTDARASNAVVATASIVDAPWLCDYSVRYGCADPSAANYRSGVIALSSTCQYGGGTDPAAENFDASATYHDGTCEYLRWGCTDPSAINYVRPAWAPLRVCLLCPARAA